MKLKLIPALVIFVSSYFPLVLVLAIKDFDFSARQFHNPAVVSVLLVLSVFACAVTLLAAKSAKDGVVVTLTKVSNKSADMFTYTIPYMIAFYKFDLADLNMVLSLAVFMALMFLLSYRTQTLFVNPVLAIAGYGLYDCQFRDGASDGQGLVLSDNELQVGQEFRVQKITAFLYFVTEKIQEGTNNG